jgi:hypothetical protein
MVKSQPITLDQLVKNKHLLEESILQEKANQHQEKFSQNGKKYSFHMTEKNTSQQLMKPYLLPTELQAGGNHGQDHSQETQLLLAVITQLFKETLMVLGFQENYGLKVEKLMSHSVERNTKFTNSKYCATLQEQK